MADLNIHKVRKSYESHAVIHDISVDIPDGAFTVLVGPSGCGKSTLLRMIAGLESITSGQIRVAGRVVNDVSPKDRNMAMVFQNYALYPHMTVRENMGFSLKISNVRKTEIEQRVSRAAEILALSPLLERYPRQLSGGQRQRVALARALAREPAILLLDEPFGALDTKVRRELRGALREIHDRVGLTSIFVTHDREEAFALADTVAILSAGKIEQFAAPREIEQAPASDFVRDFVI